MSFDWLNKFHKDREKPEDYAEKTLAQYRLGMKGGGSIAGVSILIDEDGCDACLSLEAGVIYHPDEAPRLPLPGCSKGRQCRCVYRPVMTYQVSDEENAGDA
ncbi:MAG: hypothetical protein CSA11_01760 [Chloroflexi bacterium]|nr:MAG: hypothetical protein CSA11_01760 [Chloroflexota bacterium]